MSVLKFAIRAGGTRTRIIAMMMVVLSTPTWLGRPAFLRDSEDNGVYDIRHLRESPLFSSFAGVIAM